MDKRKYLTKTLIAEFKTDKEISDFNFSETAYKLKDGSILIEYYGEPLSLYGLKIAFNKNIAKKGIFKIDLSDYELWKSIRNKCENGYFIDWELEKQLQFNQVQEEIFRIQKTDHENILELITTDDLPF